jgi:hypothetical protein
MEKAGVGLAEQVVEPRAFLDRLKQHGLVPVIEEPRAVARRLEVVTSH